MLFIYSEYGIKILVTEELMQKKNKNAQNLEIPWQTFTWEVMINKQDLILSTPILLEDMFY